MTKDKDPENNADATAQESLQVDSALFSRLVLDSQDGAILTNEKGLIVSWNERMQQTAGLSTEEALGQHVVDALHSLAPPELHNPQHYADLQKAFGAALKKGRLPYQNRSPEVDYIHPNGERRKVQETWFTIQSGQGYRLGAVVRDFTASAQTEKALRENQAQLSTLLENSNASIWSVDRNYCLMIGNSAFMEQCRAGLGRAIEVGESVMMDFLPTAEKEEWQGFYDRALGGESYRFERERRYSPNPAWTEYHLTPIHNENEECVGVTVVAHDITGRKQAEEALRQQSEGMAELLALTQDFLQMSASEIDFQKITDDLLKLSGGKYAAFNLFDENGKDFRTVALSGVNAHSRKAVSILGFELVGKKWPPDPVRAKKTKQHAITRFASLQDLTGRVLSPSAVALIQKTFALGESVIGRIHVGEKTLGDFTILMPAGTPFRADNPVSIYARQVGLLLQRTQAEEALRASEERFRKIFELSPLGISIFDQHAKLLRANRALCTMLGYSEAELLEIGIEGFSHPEDMLKDSDLLAQLFEGKIDQYSFEKRYLHKNGEILCGVLTVSLARDAQGEVLFGIGMLVDITERKKAEEIAIYSQKMAGIGNLAAGMAHEINSPLQLVTGLSERLTRDLNADRFDKEQFLTDVERINKNGWRIANIVRSLLTYSRQAANEINPHQLNDLVEDTLFLIEHQLKTWSSITVSKELAEEMPPVCCDGNNITQVIINLLENARDAMDAGGGEITIRTAYDRAAQRFMLQVHNSGRPIPEDIQARIFEPFFTTKDVGKGTGLGLSIVHGIVAAHGGEITVESAAGQGTTFSIYLPPEPPLQNDNSLGSGRYQMD